MNQKLRRITLNHQGLTTSRPFGKGIEATKNALDHLGYIQIDTLSVIERAHHHTLWTRIPDYQPDHLNQLVKDRSAFEYWSHAASYLPMRDYRFVLPQMSAIKNGESHYHGKVEQKYINHVIDRIRIDGPLRARDFESPKKSNAKWWNWKPTKRALEKLFMQGDLMVSGRDGMQKIYDLRERVLPEDINTSEPSLPEFAEYLIDTSVRANGFTLLKQLTHLRAGKPLREALTTILKQKIEQGTLVKCSTAEMPTLYITQKALDKKIAKPSANTRLLSPFDNAIIHRDRAQQLFEFDYKLECYTPKAKRQFGYFCLPILYKDKLIGRVDCKAHRKTSEFELIDLYIESKDLDLDPFVPLFSKTVSRFAKFNACKSVRVSKVTPKKLTNIFRKVLS